MSARQLRARIRRTLGLAALGAAVLTVGALASLLLLTAGSLRPLLERRDYTATVELNWDLSLPESSRGRSTRRTPAPVSTGTAERYHVLQYAVGSGIESALSWQAPPGGHSYGGGDGRR